MANSRDFSLWPSLNVFNLVKSRLRLFFRKLNENPMCFVILFILIDLNVHTKALSAHAIDIDALKSEFALADTTQHQEDTKGSLLTNENSLFKEAFLENKIKCTSKNEDPTLGMFFNPTVVKATAIKAFQIADTSSYSIAFQIKKILKYENRVFNGLRHTSAYENYYQISSQDEKVDEINFNSFILVEYFDLNLLIDEACNNKIKIGSDYFLFLKSLDPSIRLEHRRFFTFPIFFSSLGLNSKIAHKTAHSKTFQQSKWSVNANQNTNETFFTRMPVFEASYSPTLATIDVAIESKLERLLCLLDAYCLVSEEQDSEEETQKTSRSDSGTLLK